MHSDRGIGMETGIKSTYRVLVVDDEIQVINSIRNILANETSIEVQTALTGTLAIDLVSKAPHKYALILMDYNLDDMSGAETTKRILKINPNQIVIMNSGDESREAAVDAWRAGAVDFIEKRSGVEVLKEKIRQLELISEDHFFEHPYFGNMKKRPTVHFLEIHTKHHIKIIREIVAAIK